MLGNRAKAPTTEDFRNTPGYPSEKRMRSGPVAIIECEQEIPCNPCETSCHKKAITIGSPITNLPKLDEDLCIGCGQCIAGCPGQAIFLVDKSYTKNTALVAIPFEYVPLPQKESQVNVRNRDGEVIGVGTVKKMIVSEATDKTVVLYLEVDKSIGEEVRAIER